MSKDTARPSNRQAHPEAIDAESPQPDFFEIARAIRSKESGLSATQRLVLQEIIDRARDGSGVCTWSTAEIAEFVGLSERHCREIIAKLEAVGLLVIERRGPNKFCVKVMSAGPKLIELARGAHDAGPKEFRLGVDDRCRHHQDPEGGEA